nr:collagen [Mimivirus sp.]
MSNNYKNLQNYIDQRINQIQEKLLQHQSIPFCFPGKNGSKGDKGEQGKDGKDGNEIIIGYNGPNNNTGDNNDIYLDECTNNIYVKKIINGYLLIISGENMEQKEKRVKVVET